MIKVDNFRESFSGDQSQYNSKILGLEIGNKYLVAQTFKNSSITRICLFNRNDKNFMVLFTKKGRLNIVQASINSTNDLLVFVTKDKINDVYHENEGNNVTSILSASKNVYNVTAVDLKKIHEISDLAISSEKQIKVQFLYRKKANNSDRLLILTHLKEISLYELDLKEGKRRVKLLEIVTHSFAWAQWDGQHQCLFYISNKKQAIREDEPATKISDSPVLSAFQFHDDMPHETVLNVPLNLPQAKMANTSDAQISIYDDVPIPLRIHDCSLNILVLMQSTGLVYICHYYFYQPVTAENNTESSSFNSNQTMHFAYSITVLHHGSIIHCSVPSINWNKALDLKPVFSMHGDQHLIVYVSNLFTHVLDLGIEHEACCHFVTSSPSTLNSFSKLVPIPGCPSEILDLSSFDMYKSEVSRTDLIKTYLNRHLSIQNKLSILHYVLVHLNDLDMTQEMISTMAHKVADLNNVKVMKEFLIGACYAAVSRHISSDSMDLLRSLPLTTVHSGSMNENINNFELNVEQEMLCNPSVILLTPRQRLIPYRSDIWTKLWNHLPSHILTNCQSSRFKSSTVVDKLAMSLACYQPEALSRCCTPLSPGVPHMASTGMLAEISNISRANKLGIDPLAFAEVEASAASKQEHVISVNLREISLHLVKLGKGHMEVHAVAIKYCSAQLEASRMLCSYLTKSVGIDTKLSKRGFSLVDQLEKDHRRMLYGLLERYYVAIDTLAFPVPQGFTSFFAYLGYRIFPKETYLNYVRAHVFQVNIDVMKAIMADLSGKKGNLRTQLNLLVTLPRSRVRRILNQWQHPVSLMYRAREHSMNILSGISGIQNRVAVLPKGIRQGAGLTAFPSNERLSPLDTFLDLLTAKASLTDIDFSLLIEATAASMENFLDGNDL